MNDLRDQIADVICGTNADADAVLALPAIADAVALAELCAPLTIGQVARALQHASRRFAMPEHIGLLTDDEKAIASWEDKR